MNDYYWSLKMCGHKKYDPSQPRISAGNPRGGQWTSGGIQPPSISNIDTSGLPPELEKRAQSILHEPNVKTWHLEGLNSFTEEPPPGNPSWERFEQLGGSDAAGWYNEVEGKVHLNPRVLARTVASATIAHELGHHVRSLPKYYNERFPLIQNRLAGLRALNDFDLGRMGITHPDARNSEEEFMADAYRVYVWGPREARVPLAQYLGVGSLDEIYG